MKRYIFPFVTIFFMMTLWAGVNIAYGSDEGDAKRGEILFRSPLLLGTIPISCATCHPDGQGLERTWGKKEFVVLGDKVTRLEAVIDFWIVNILRGKGIKYDSQEMKDLKSYIKSLYGKTERPLPKAVPLEKFDVPEFYP
ncbi:MAG: hypothetical protein HY755_04445 [Nitrospirae bacterium]|nr:hypothetical protein [Nitrospirota bacterium]